MNNNDRINKILNNEEFKLLKIKLDKLEENRVFCKHDLNHSLDVARIMYIKSLEENLKFSKDIIYGAALLHDLGRVLQYENQIPHNEGSAIIAEKILLECDYSKEEIEIITKAIKSHRKDSENADFSKLLYDSDKLSRICFNCSSERECYWDNNKKNHKIIY